MLLLSSSATSGRLSARVGPCSIHRTALPRLLQSGQRSSSAGAATTACRAASGGGSGGSPLEGLINSLTVALKNSPLNAGKIAMAKAQAGDYDAAATRAKIEGLIASEPLLVFSWSGCPFCKSAKALLQNELGASATVLELDTMGPEGKAIRAELAELTGRTSVPNIWIRGKNVGGCNDGPGVVTLHKQGKLVPMLQAAGALA